MRHNFKQIMTWLAEYEGGFVNHPKDPGGATNRGVTQRVYDAFRRRNGVQTQSVRFITDAEHDEIYKRQYWNPVRGNDLPSGFDASVFDMAVHSGVSRAAKYLQQIVGTRRDGIIGEMTLQALHNQIEAGRGEELIKRYNANRLAFLKRLSTWPTFGRGWRRRVVGNQDGAQERDIGVVDRSVMLFRGQTMIPKPKRPGIGRASEDHQRPLPWFFALITGLFGAWADRRKAQRVNR